MTSSHTLEVSKRNTNGQFVPLKNGKYPLNGQQVVRIGRAESPEGDFFVIPKPEKDESGKEAFEKNVQLLHLLLRAKQSNFNGHEILNVSTESIYHYRPTNSDPQKMKSTVNPNDGAVTLIDYDYIEFGKGNYQLTYLTGEWVDMEITLVGKGLPYSGVNQYKVTFRQNDTIDATIKVMPSKGTTRIRKYPDLSCECVIQGLDRKFFAWDKDDSTSNQFHGTTGYECKYDIRCIADCKAPGFATRINFIARLLQGNQILHTAARSMAIEVVPCGPFVLNFGQPR